MLAKDPTGGAVPAFMTVRFCDDHTSGVSRAADAAIDGRGQ